MNRPAHQGPRNPAAANYRLERSPLNSAGQAVVEALKNPRHFCNNKLSREPAINTDKSRGVFTWVRFAPEHANVRGRKNSCMSYSLGAAVQFRNVRKIFLYLSPVRRRDGTGRDEAEPEASMLASKVSHHSENLLSRGNADISGARQIVGPILSYREKPARGSLALGERDSRVSPQDEKGRLHLAEKNSKRENRQLPFARGYRYLFPQLNRPRTGAPRRARPTRAANALRNQRTRFISRATVLVRAPVRCPLLEQVSTTTFPSMSNRDWFRFTLSFINRAIETLADRLPASQQRN